MRGEGEAERPRDASPRRRGKRRAARWLAVLAAVLAAGLVALSMFLRMPGRSLRGPLPPLTDRQETAAARLRGDVERLAGRIGERHLWRYESLSAAAAAVEDALAAAGYAVADQWFVADGRPVRNLEAERVGVRPASGGDLVVVGAHYDTVPGCPGADDNASGVAGVLEIARLLGQKSFAKTLIFACWDEEETGLHGSRAFVARLPASRRLTAHFNFEMIAFASGVPDSQTIPSGFSRLFPAQVAALEANQRRADFVALVADSASAPAAARFVVEANAIGLPVQRLDVPDVLKGAAELGDLRRSDHAAFWDAGLPGIMITDTADFRNPSYHCRSGSDTVATLNFDFATKVVRATARAAAGMASE